MKGYTKPLLLIFFVLIVDQVSKDLGQNKYVPRTGV